MAYSYDNLKDINRTIIEAYASMTSETSHMPEGIEHRVSKQGNVTTHSFARKHLEDVHNHLTNSGYKQDGPSSVYGPATETRYVNPTNRKVAYLGSNTKSAWLDIHQ